MARCPRRETPCFIRMQCTWNFTVPRVFPSLFAISLLLSPRAISRAICCSRFVSARRLSDFMEITAPTRSQQNSVEMEPARQEIVSGQTQSAHKQRINEQKPRQSRAGLVWFHNDGVSGEELPSAAFNHTTRPMPTWQRNRFPCRPVSQPIGLGQRSGRMKGFRF